jgi:hypothetical protein
MSSKLYAVLSRLDEYTNIDHFQFPVGLSPCYFIWLVCHAAYNSDTFEDYDWDSKRDMYRWIFFDLADVFGVEQCL